MFHVLTLSNVVTLVGGFETPFGKVVITVRKVVSDTVKVVTQLDTVATTAE